MTLQEVLISINAILLGIVTFFLKRTMSKVDKTAEKTYTNTNDIALLKQETGFKHDRLEEKLDDLKDVIVTLTQEIKVLNNR